MVVVSTSPPRRSIIRTGQTHSLDRRGSLSGLSAYHVSPGIETSRRISHRTFRDNAHPSVFNLVLPALVFLFLRRPIEIETQRYMTFWTCWSQGFLSFRGEGKLLGRTNLGLGSEKNFFWLAYRILVSQFSFVFLLVIPGKRLFMVFGPCTTFAFFLLGSLSAERRIPLLVSVGALFHLVSMGWSTRQTPALETTLSSLDVYTQGASETGTSGLEPG
jgi:hypothetical protein